MAGMLTVAEADREEADSEEADMVCADMRRSAADVGAFTRASRTPFGARPEGVSMRICALVARTTISGSLPGRARFASSESGSGPCSGSTSRVVQSLQPCFFSLTRTWIEVPAGKALRAVTATSEAGAEIGTLAATASFSSLPADSAPTDP